MTIAATATYTDLQIGPGQYSYTLTLNNTGTTTIGTFWFAWDDVPDQDFMSANPAVTSSPTGWSASISTHLYPSGIGYGIEWQSLSNAALLTPGASVNLFTFTSTETPAEMAGQSIFDPTFAVTSAFVYIGAALADPGYQLTATPACFCRGTLILTDRGEVAVEELTVGDQVKTLAGALKPIVWIGFGRDLVTRTSRLARPVVVRRGALADNVPRRDLYLTHGHALYIDGVLLPVENLVNHRSIQWDDAARVVEYYHIELAEHDVLLAEGAPAESYYDAGNRAPFQTVRGGSKPGTATPTFAPVLNGGDIADQVWAALYKRAGGQIERDTTEDPDLHLVVDGERLDPAGVGECVYSFTLERPPDGTLHLRSRNGVPSLLGITRHDHRQLGVAIGRIVLHQAGITTSFEYYAPLFGAGGCHPAEYEFCWTDGEFDLPKHLFAHLTGTFTLAVHTERPGMRYPIPALMTDAA